MTYAFTSEQLEWLDALESGKYEQGKTFLNKNNKFCCLGVACDLFAEKLGLVIENDDGIIGYANKVEDQSQRWESDYTSTTLPKPIMELLKIRDNCGEFINKTVIASKNDYGTMSYGSLAGMNDSGNFSFKDIAEYIRNNPENVFKA